LLSAIPGGFLSMRQAASWDQLPDALQGAITWVRQTLETLSVPAGGHAAGGGRIVGG
jgi:hypothetical protein